MDSKGYPKHKMKAGGSSKVHGKGKPDYVGSGALHDRYRTPADEKVSHIPARGSEKSFMHDGSRTHNAQSIHVEDALHHMPGQTNPKAMRLGKTHGFRAHGVTKHDTDTAVLRFSGNSGAHRIGANRGKFGKSNYHTQGLPNVNGKKFDSEVGMAGIVPIGKSVSKVQRGDKKQPKKGSGNKTFPGHREAGKD